MLAVCGSFKNTQSPPAERAKEMRLQSTSSRVADKRKSRNGTLSGGGNMVANRGVGHRAGPGWVFRKSIPKYGAMNVTQGEPGLAWRSRRGGAGLI